MADNSNRTWLVTGAAGFIGSNLCGFLLGRGERVVALDDLSSGRIENIERLKGISNDRFDFIRGSIADLDTVKSAMSGADIIAHLAAQVSVQESIERPDITEAINIRGFENIVESAKETGIKRIVYASSSAVYGDNEHLPISESEPLLPKSPYAVSKMNNEQVAESFNKDGKIAIGFRFFNIFGPNQNADGGYAAVIPKWIAALKSRKTPIIFGEGDATRDFCQVENVCRAFWAVADPEFVPAIPVYNIGAGNEVSLTDLYDLIAGELKSLGVVNTVPDVDHQPWRDGDIYRSVADINAAHRDFAYSPEVGLEQGIRRLLDPKGAS